MASEIGSDRANYSQDLRDTQESYRKRREQVEEDGQAELEKTRKDTSERLSREKSTGDAAINHTRSANRERLEQLKQENEQRVVYERNASNRALHSERARSKEEIEALEDNKHTREAQLDSEMRHLSQRENEMRSRESEDTNSIAREQEQRRAHIMEQEQDKLREFGERVQHRKQELNNEAKEEISHLADRHRREVAGLQDQHKQIYAKQQEAGETALKNQLAMQSGKLGEERERFSKQELAQRTRASEELQREQDDANQKILSVKGENQQEFARAHQKGVEGMEKTRAYYDRNIAAIEKRGDVKIAEQKQIQENKVRLLTEQNKNQLETEKTNHAKQLEDENDQYTQQSLNNKDFYRKSLVEQKREYDSAFKKNLDAFAAQVKNQREMLRNSLAKEKKEVVEDVGKYNSKNSDPFYRLTEPRARLTEHQDHYVVEAAVPEHERENFKIVVHDGKVILQGQRRFEDEVEDPTSKIATHNFQTYRQEIPLEHPVHERLFAKSYENGILKVKIPKA